MDLLNYLISRYNFTSYLEIGCSANECFNSIKCSQKVGVDPAAGGTHRMTSDEFFAMNQASYDLIFIDGLHWSEQVLKDVLNSLQVLTPKGLIVLHDCNPPTELAATWPNPHPHPYPFHPSWNGDVWKAVLNLRGSPTIDVAVGDFDSGCGVIQQRPNTDPLKLTKSSMALTYQQFDPNRQKWLRLMSFDNLKKWLA
jgi:hypothetical protein